MNKPASSDIKIRIQRIERLLRILLIVSLVQTVLLTMITISYFLPNLFSFFQLIIFLGLLGAGAYVFRNQIPQWFGDASRYVFSHLKEPDAR